MTHTKTFEDFCKDNDFGFIFNKLNPSETDGLLCELLVGGKLWGEKSMREMGYIFTDVNNERIFESALYTLKRERPSFTL